MPRGQRRHQPGGATIQGSTAWRWFVSVRELPADRPIRPPSRRIDAAGVLLAPRCRAGRQRGRRRRDRPSSVEGVPAVPLHAPYVRRFSSLRAPSRALQSAIPSDSLHTGWVKKWFRQWPLLVLPIVVVVVAARILRRRTLNGGHAGDGGGGLGGVREPRRPKPSPPAMAAALAEPGDTRTNRS